jgi:hypothetical protein
MLPSGFRVQIDCDVRIFRTLDIAAVLSAGLKSRLYGPSSVAVTGEGGQSRMTAATVGALLHQGKPAALNPG